MYKQGVAGVGNPRRGICLVRSINGCNPSISNPTEAAASAWSPSVRVDTQNPAVSGAPGGWIAGGGTPISTACNDSPTGGPDCGFCNGDPNCGNIVAGCYASGCDAATYKLMTVAGAGHADGIESRIQERRRTPQLKRELGG